MEITPTAQKQCDMYSSPQINELAAALSKAQGMYRRANPNRKNPFFKSDYADHDAIMDSVREALEKNGLALIQPTRIGEDGREILCTILTHASGQWIESRAKISPVKADIQSYGSTVSYLKRYQALCILGQTVSDKDDDDGETEMQERRNGHYEPKQDYYEKVVKEQVDQIIDELDGHPDLAKEILTKMKIKSFDDMPKDKFMATIKRIREIKELNSTRN